MSSGVNPQCLVLNKLREMTFHRMPVIMFSAGFILALVLVIFTWHHGVQSFLPKQEISRPRRISIAELSGKVNTRSSGQNGDIPAKDNHGIANTNIEGKEEKSAEKEIPSQKGLGTNNRSTPIDVSSEKRGHSEKPEELDMDILKHRPMKAWDGGPRIFCMIFTTMSNWRAKGQAVRDTWAQRCHVYKFFYTPPENNDKRLPVQDAVPLNVEEGRDHLTAKTMTGLRWSYTHYNEDVDWFFKADDDTFVVMENLRFVAAQFLPSQPHYIGGRSMDLLKHGYNGGGAGYLLSHETARLLLEEGPKYPKRCKNDGSIEDLDIGTCLETLNVYPIDTTDSQGRLTFHPDHPYKIWAGEGDSWRVYTYRLHNKTYGYPKGIKVMSPHTVSFHYVKPSFMYMYDFLLYHLVRHQLSEAGTNAGMYSEKQPHR